MKAFLALIVAVVLVGLGGCEGPTTVTPDTAAFRVSGTIRNPKGLPIPPTTKFYALWMVSRTSPDYSYVFGVGTIDIGRGTFEIVFESDPPDEACNSRADSPNDPSYVRAGVAYIIAFEDPKNLIIPGVRLGDIDDDDVKLVGAVNNTAIIYRKGTDEACENFFHWLPDFTPGYSIGVGVENPDSKDFFIPAPSGYTLELLIDDDADSFIFPNWT